MDMDNHMLTRLVDGFDEVKQTLTRVEENVKPIADIKRDVDLLKISMSEVVSSSKSAHKRIDDVEKDLEKAVIDSKSRVADIPSRAEHTNHDKRITKIESTIFWIGTTIIGFVILAVLGAVLLTK